MMPGKDIEFQRNMVARLIRSAKINYSTKLNPALSDPLTSAKRWWGIVKSLYGNKYYPAIPAICEGDILVSDSKKKPDLFNDYFVSEARIPFMDSAEVPSLRVRLVP